MTQSSPEGAMQNPAWPGAHKIRRKSARRALRRLRVRSFIALPGAFGWGFPARAPVSRCAAHSAYLSRFLQSLLQLTAARRFLGRGVRLARIARIALDCLAAVSRQQQCEADRQQHRPEEHAEEPESDEAADHAEEHQHDFRRGPM